MHRNISEMQIFIDKKTKVEFFRWYQNGDLPDDKYKAPGDKSNIIRPFQYSQIQPFTICPICENYYYSHGFIFYTFETEEANRMEKENNLDGGQIVCPGSWILKTDREGVIHFSVVHQNFIYYCTNYEIDED